ncbi:ureidoglycolate hydrolase protein, partial [Fulvimarina pelagi HTCC2506]
MWELKTTPLSADAFRPFGEVIETDNASEIRLINKGTTTRFHDIAPVDVSAEGGHPLISIFRGKPFDFPIRIEMMERHPLGSQAFMPLSARPYLIVVAHDESGAPGEPVAFLAAPGQASPITACLASPVAGARGGIRFLVVDA